MALAHRWSSRNLSRLELVFALIVIIVLAGAYLGRALWLFAQAEAQSLEVSVLNLNSALRVRYYELVMTGHADQLAGWQDGNPVALLGDPGTLVGERTAGAHPELARFNASASGLAGAYAGEFDFLDPEQVTAGQWYFDRTESRLVYLVRNREFFHSALPGPARVRFRLQFRFDDQDGDGVYNPGTERPRDLFIEAVDDYAWQREALAR